MRNLNQTTAWVFAFMISSCIFGAVALVLSRVDSLDEPASSYMTTESATPISEPATDDGEEVFVAPETPE